MERKVPIDNGRPTPVEPVRRWVRWIVHNHEPAGLSLRTARAFGESLTTARPWNTSAEVVEQLNGRVAMVGFTTHCGG